MLKENLTNETISEIIGHAWADDVSFDVIEKTFGLKEKEVIEIMRSHLKPSSFRLWRKRVSGRKTKHDKVFALSANEKDFECEE